MFEHLKAYFQYILPKQALTHAAGFLAGVKTPFIKNYLIRHFIRLYGVNMQEAREEQANNYENFNAFFIRHLKENIRPISTAGIVSPVDGCISEIGDIQQGQIFQAKGHYYSTLALLAGDEKLSNIFANGRFATLYLSPKDYHRIHMPMDATLLQTIYVPGKLFSVQPASVAYIPGIFARNKRLITVFQTDAGLMAMVLVGATIVGAIGTRWQGDVPDKKSIFREDYTHTDYQNIVKGEEMGYFKLGSTVILLFADRDAMVWNPVYKAGSPIRLGESLGVLNVNKDT